MTPITADPHPHWAETVGRPLPHISVRIAQPGDGATVALGQVGEICTRSTCVMAGYYNDPASTAQAIDADGWLHTGDLGTMDGLGYLRIAGRLKDMIIRGGENVYPREIEDLLQNHVAVAEAAVVGVPDNEWGEQIAAVVRLRGPVTSDELTTFCRLHLASFKVPRLWRFVDEFPQTASGKVLKLELRDQPRDERDYRQDHPRTPTDPSNCRRRRWAINSSTWPSASTRVERRCRPNSRNSVQVVAGWTSPNSAC